MIIYPGAVGLIGAFWFFGFQTTVNSLISWLGAFNGTVADGPLPHFPGLGFRFTGSPYITTDFNISTAARWAQDSAEFGGFIDEDLVLNDNNEWYGNSSSNNADLYARNNGGFNRIQAGINSARGNSGQQ